MRYLCSIAGALLMCVALGVLAQAGVDTAKGAAAEKGAISDKGGVADKAGIADKGVPADKAPASRAPASNATAAAGASGAPSGMGTGTPQACNAAAAPGPDSLVLLGRRNPANDNELTAADLSLALGEPLHFRATGRLAQAICLEFTKPLEARTLALYLDGVRMDKLESRPIYIDAPQDVRFAFVLERNANIDENRKAWDALLKSKPDYEMTLQAAVAAGNEPPRRADSANLSLPFRFRVATRVTIFWVFGLGLAVFLAAYLALIFGSGMLREAETGFYSLGKSQMAFWGLLVLISFFGVWYLTGTMERIPPQTLVLLGISGATGLAAIFVGGQSKADIDRKLKEALADLTTLETKKTALEASIAAARASGTSPTQADLANLASTNADIDTRTRLVKALTPQNFWYDIVNDGNGLSFHRAQVVAWTLVLGLVFVRSIMQMMSMPEFPDSLLVLMGISNATYVGFKVQEKKQ